LASPSGHYEASGLIIERFKGAFAWGGMDARLALIDHF